MSAVATMQVRGARPRLEARITGVMYLLTVVTGLFAEGFVNQRMVTPDAATTAANVLAHKGLFQLAFAVYLIEMACDVAMTALFYDLLKPVNRAVAVVALSIGLTGCTIKTMGRLFFIAPVFILGGHSLAAFTAPQLQALAMLSFHWTDQAAEMALVFFGLYAILNGWLIARSTFLPRVLGVVGIVCGLGWLTFLDPPLAHRLFLYLLVIALPSSLALAGWMLVVGVNEERWKEQARLTAQALLT